MFKVISKIFPTVIFWGIFIFAILTVPYPENLTHANVVQMLSFFIPLYLAFTFTFNIFLINILVSSSISLGLIFILVLKALDSLNIVTGVLIIITIGLLVSYFRKIKRKGLTYTSKIPKLTHLRKRNNL